MKNPLMKRLPKELKSELGKYLVLFLFITGMISIVSGFLVAGESMEIAYNESFEKYNIEHGNFELATKADQETIANLEKENLTIYDNFYIEEGISQFDSTLRVFVNREYINKPCLMEGKMPTNINEIAIDRMHAANNDMSIGDTILFGDDTLTITGFIALPDYSTLYQNPSDMMFDAIKFGVGIVSLDTFNSLNQNHIHYSYSWKYNSDPTDDKEAKNMADDFLKVLSKNGIIQSFNPEYSNQAIHWTGNDLGRDKTIISAFLYIAIVIISFVFAITTSTTITKESAVIGTLRASGYTRFEILKHYLTMPILVTLISALAGNILGYTLLKDFAVSMYYNSYSLPTYVTVWNAKAFIKTTIIPILLMFTINIVMLTNKLKLSPLKFIRHDLSKRKNKKAFRINSKIAIMKRFRIRIIFQNMPNYITIIFGIFFASFLILFGLGLKPVVLNYQDEITANMICSYQYILKAPISTTDKNAEQYAIKNLQTADKKIKPEQATIYGLINESNFFDFDVDNNNVYISSAYSEKYKASIGDTITLTDEYSGKQYSFIISGVHYYPSSIAIFADLDYFNDIFENESGYYNGYFSNEKLDDIDEMYVATTITADDMTKSARQILHSMGDMITLFALFGVIMFMLIIYLLSKIIIEKNSQSISMTKILGYTDQEINRLYIFSTSLVVITALLVTIPICSFFMKYIFIVMFSSFPGWIPYVVPSYVYIQAIILGLLTYAVICCMQMKKIKKVPLTMALKNVE